MEKIDTYFEEYVFTYLDKRHKINGVTVMLKDDNPRRHLRNMFDVAGGNVMRKWVISRIGNQYCKKFPNGTKRWYKDGELHRDDGPAVIYSSGVEEWYLNGKLHRLDGPAIIHPDGGEAWYLNGKEHREDGPAIIHSNGTKEWWVKGSRHRDGGPALITASGYREWWVNGIELGGNFFEIDLK